LQQHWLFLARSYEFTGRLTDFPARRNESRTNCPAPADKCAKTPSRLGPRLHADGFGAAP
jgi:hypothetical protein